MRALGLVLCIAAFAGCGTAGVADDAVAADAAMGDVVTTNAAVADVAAPHAPVAPAHDLGEASDASPTGCPDESALLLELEQAGTRWEAADQARVHLPAVYDALDHLAAAHLCAQPDLSSSALAAWMRRLPHVHVSAARTPYFLGPERSARVASWRRETDQRGGGCSDVGGGSGMTSGPNSAAS